MSLLSSNKSHSRQASAPAFFIADLHLDPERFEACALALDFFRKLPASASLYILGDLFEYWIGDDAGIALYPEIIDALAHLDKRHCKTYVMHGNRDFLLGESFAEAAKVDLVRADELLISLDGLPVLLMHGDTLCIDDKPYQAFRQTLRDAHWQANFLKQPVSERMAYAQQLREQSTELTSRKVQSIMDVNEACVSKRLAVQGCHTLIHGHTHRPAVHDRPRQGAGHQRLVVGDWHATHAQYVLYNSDGLQLKRFDRAPCTPAPSL